MWGFPHPGAIPSSRDADSVSTKKIIDTPEGKLAESLMMLFGSRTLVMGVAFLSTSYWGSHKALTAMMWSGNFVAFVDGLISLRQIGGGQWIHWGFVSPCLAFLVCLRCFFAHDKGITFFLMSSTRIAESN